MTRRNDIKPSNVFISWTSKDKHIEQKILAHLDKNAITVCESGKGCAGDYKQWSNDAAIAPDIFMLILTKNLVCYPTSLARDEMKAWKNMLKETGDSSNRTVIVCPSLDIIKEFKDESGDLIISEEDHINCEVYSEEDGLTEENLENILNKIRNLFVHRMSDIYAKKSVEDIGINIPRLLGVDLIYLENNKAEYDDLYIPRTVKLRNGQFNNSEELISQSDTDLLFITADAGVGKSCYIKQIFKENNGNDAFVLSVGCAEAANNILNNRNCSQYPSLAVFLYKRFILTCGFENSFYTLENFITLLKNKVAEEKRVIVALDALDEIANFTRINEFIREVEILREFFNGKIKIVITDRSDVNARKFTNVNVAKLERFNDGDVTEYCNRFLRWIDFSCLTNNCNNVKLNDLEYRVKNLSEEIRQNPLMLTQISLIYVLTGKIKDDEIGIFDDMTEVLFKREKLKAFLGLNRNIPGKIVELLTVFAYNRQICVSQGKKWTRQKAIKLFDDILSGINIDAGNLQCVGISGEELVDYLVYRSFFDFERDKFCHLRYGEYFVARYYCYKVFDDDGNMINQEVLDEILSHCGEECWKYIINLFVKRSGISKIKIPDGVENICDYTFNDCYSLENIIISNSVTMIGQAAFESCKSLSTLDVPVSVKEIKACAFKSCSSMKSLVIGGGVETMGFWAFQDCSALVSVRINNGVKKIGSWAFQDCISMISVEIPDTVENLGFGIFNGCISLKSIRIGKRTKTLGKWIFSGCSSLDEVIIPDNVNTIEVDAFYKCDSLKKVTFLNSRGWYADEKAIDYSILSNDFLAAIYLTKIFTKCIWKNQYNK